MEHRNNVGDTPEVAKVLGTFFKDYGSVRGRLAKAGVVSRYKELHPGLAARFDALHRSAGAGVSHNSVDEWIAQDAEKQVLAGRE